MTKIDTVKKTLVIAAKIGTGTVVGSIVKANSPRSDNQIIDAAHRVVAVVTAVAATSAIEPHIEAGVNKTVDEIVDMFN